MKTLYRSTVSEFYRQHAGFFLAVILLAFGFLSGGEHKALAMFFVTDKTGPPYLAAIWAAYWVLVRVFWSSLWASPPYVFIYQTRLLPPAIRFYRLAVLAAGLLLPAIAYGIWIIGNAAQAGLLPGAVKVTGILLIYWACLVFSADWQLKHQNIAANRKSLPVRFWFRRPASWIFWTAEWLIREKGLTLLLCKLGVTLFTICTLLYFGTDDYDIRLPAIGLSIATLANIGISYEIWHWENDIWRWRRSLPIPLLTRAFLLIGIHLLILVPDFLLSIRYANGLLTFPELAQLFLLQLAILLAYHGLLYKKDAPLDESLGAVFKWAIVLTLLILYRVPLPALAASLLLSGGWNYYKWAP
ncbi:hypothetical protein GCM10023091_24750 [Ravibacter arvi]|uniref:Uncharacterized protein n=1 Tax=Ravibacter arvi TaxID=2051041 RepID=A0ABP8M0U5_9BACT